MTRPKPEEAGGPALVVEGLVVEADGHRILDEVSLRLERGEFLCLLGPNGGGKTTLLKAVLGLLPVTRGRLEVLGGAPEATRSRVGYLPQRKGFDRGFPATVADLLVAARTGRWPLRLGERDRETVRAALLRVGGEALLDKRVAALSGGETQRVFLARALVTAPELLLLDEPTAGVDPGGRSELLALLEEVTRGGGLAAVLVTHNRAAAERLADRVIVLDRRILRQGQPHEVLLEESTGPRGGHDHVDAPSLACEEE